MQPSGGCLSTMQRFAASFGAGAGGAVDTELEAGVALAGASHHPTRPQWLVHGNTRLERIVLIRIGLDRIGMIWFRVGAYGEMVAKLRGLIC